MASVALGINLVPVFMTTLASICGSANGLTQEKLGRLGAATFAGVVAAVGSTGPLTDRWGAKPFVQLGNILTAAQQPSHPATVS